MDSYSLDKNIKLYNLSKNKIQNILGIILVNTPKNFNMKIADDIDAMKKENSTNVDHGVHFVIDDIPKSVFSLCDEKQSLSFVDESNCTYIAKAIFNNKMKGQAIYCYIPARMDEDYVLQEKQLIQYLVILLRKYKLCSLDVWRGFDLSKKDYSPLHLLDKKIFEKYIKEIDKYIPRPKSTLAGVNGNPTKFFAAIAPGAVAAYKKYHVLPSLTMAQAAIESGYGKYSIENNLFGIKAGKGWSGGKKLCWTTEYNSAGSAYKTQAWFRTYPSVDESIEDHAKLLTGSRYKAVIAAKSYSEATAAVKAAGYATDPGYPKILNKVIKDYNLDKYDNGEKVPTATNTESTPVDDNKITISSPLEAIAKEAGKSVKDYVNDIYNQYKDCPEKYAAKFQPWDKGRADIVGSGVATTETVTHKTPFNNSQNFTITKNPPEGLDHCEKGADFFTANETPETTLVEPVYPDLVTPPGGKIDVANGSDNSKVQSKSNALLTVEEFEKRQKRFDLKNFKDIKKETTGRPINCDDPFPIDKQIEKLEQHVPKVKIDKVDYELQDDNHPQSKIGQELAANLNMTYDMVVEESKRVEKRLCKLENNLATVMRNLFRISSRMFINCVYYGGQSVYGKYNCIRCLHDDRINDGQICSLDQCLNCTRYEPIIGSVYAILNSAGTNITQVVDDLQMSYMSINNYNDLSDVSRMHTEFDNADLTKNSSVIPKPFSEKKWKDTDAEKKNNKNNKKSGFVMNWDPTVLEDQKANINSYKVEDKELNKESSKNTNKKEEGGTRELFDDTKNSLQKESENLEFNIKDYKLSEFGDGSDNSTGAGGDGGAEARKKITEYALKAVDMCAQGKAKYSQDYRYNHLDKAMGGISYWDCSSLVQGAYEAAGISGIGTNTFTQFPHCKSSMGGLIIPLSDQKSALPGDMVFFSDPPVPKDKTGIENVNVNTVEHVAIYIGDGKYAEAASSHKVPNIRISKIGSWNHEMCFGRPKALIELDKKASQGVSGKDSWNKDKQKVTSELWNASSVADSNAAGFISNMKKYGYKDILMNAAKQYSFDPYFIAALCAIESSGNPTIGGGYPGILQCIGGFATSSSDGIKKNFDIALKDLTKKANWLKKYGWTQSNMHVLASAHNCGPYAVTDAAGYTHETKPSASIPMCGKKINLSTVNIKDLSDIIGQYVGSYQPSWSTSEKKTYGTKVLRAYNYLYSKKALS